MPSTGARISRRMGATLSCRGNLSFQRCGLTEKDRTWHELTVLLDAFWVAATYDALNLGGVAVLEVLARRLVAISEAYRRNPETPNWGGARLLEGRRDAFDLVSPSLRAVVARRSREDVDREAVTVRTVRLSHAAGAAVGDAAAVGGLPNVGGGGKGGGKTGGKAPKAKAKGAGPSAAIPS